MIAIDKVYQSMMDQAMLYSDLIKSIRMILRHSKPILRF